MSLFDGLFNHSILLQALIGAVLASLACGLIGPFVVTRRISYMAGGIAHSLLGGVGLALMLSFPPIGGALLAATLATAVIGWVGYKLPQQEHTAISAIWSVGMALGIIFLHYSPGYSSDLMSYLFGNLLLLTKGDLWAMLGLDTLIFVLAFAFYRPLVAMCFDTQFSQLKGQPVLFLHFLLLGLVALTCVVLVQMVGLILVIALLTIPASIVLPQSGSMGQLIFRSTFLSLFLSLAGLLLSYTLDWPASATIILCAGFLYLGKMAFAIANR